MANNRDKYNENRISTDDLTVSLIEDHLRGCQRQRREYIQQMITQMEEQERLELFDDNLPYEYFMPSRIKGNIVYDGMLAGVGNFYDFMKDAYEEEEIQYWESREAERLKEVIQ